MFAFYKGAVNCHLIQQLDHLAKMCCTTWSQAKRSRKPLAEDQILRWYAQPPNPPSISYHRRAVNIPSVQFLPGFSPDIFRMCQVCTGYIGVEVHSRETRPAPGLEAFKLLPFQERDSRAEIRARKKRCYLYGYTSSTCIFIFIIHVASRRQPPAPHRWAAARNCQ